MKPLRVALLVVLLFAAPAFATFYYWEDKDGTTHITDNIENVPQEYRSKASSRRGALPQEEAPAVQQEPGDEQTQPQSGDEQTQPQNGSELYGGQSLEWWTDAFRKLVDEMDRLEKNLSAKKQFVTLFESGRRLGQVYEQKDADTYDRYGKEIPDDEARLASLKDEQNELRRKARIAGVPTGIRGE